MRGGMPSPQHVSAAAVLVIPPPSRRGPSLWLSPLVVGLTVALAGAATGYSASLRRTAVPMTERPPAVARVVTAGVLPIPTWPSHVEAAQVQGALGSVHGAVSPSLPAMPVRRLRRPAPDPLARILKDPITGPLTLQGQRPMPLIVIADGRAIRVKSTARTPAELLDDLRITVGSADRIIPVADEPLWSGAKVRVVRIRKVVATRQVTLPVPVAYKTDLTLPRGRVVTAPGRPGIKVQRLAQTFADGKLVSQVFAGQEVLRTSTPRVVRTGTRVLLVSRGVFAGYEYLDMLATAYAPWCCRGVDHITSIGLRAGYGVVAVDPRVIPLRSRLYIEGYGYAIAGDVGSAIKGLRIDLGMDTTRLARQFGRRPARVYIIQKAPPKNPRK